MIFSGPQVDIFHLKQVLELGGGELDASTSNGTLATVDTMLGHVGEVSPYRPPCRQGT